MMSQQELAFSSKRYPVAEAGSSILSRFLPRSFIPSPPAPPSRIRYPTARLPVRKHAKKREESKNAREPSDIGLSISCRSVPPGATGSHPLSLFFPLSFLPSSLLLHASDSASCTASLPPFISALIVIPTLRSLQTSYIFRSRFRCWSYSLSSFHFMSICVFLASCDRALQFSISLRFRHGCTKKHLEGSALGFSYVENKVEFCRDFCILLRYFFVF